MPSAQRLSLVLAWSTGVACTLTGVFVNHPFLFSLRGAKTATIQYQLFGDTLRNNQAQYDERHAFIGGPSVWMYLIGGKDRPIELKIAVPSGWKVATGEIMIVIGRSGSAVSVLVRVSVSVLVSVRVLVRGSRIVVEDMNANWTRTGFLRIAERMGAVLVGDLERLRRYLGRRRGWGWRWRGRRDA